MRSGSKWLFALSVFVAAGCDAPPQMAERQVSVATEAEDLFGCPSGMVNCCGDGVCIAVPACKYTQCDQ